MPYVFPDVSNNPRGLDGTIIHFGSIGSNRIFNYFRENANSYGPPKWDLYLINIYTLVRNAYQKGIDQTLLEQLVDKDADTFMLYIGAYTTYRQAVPSVVFFYAPDYSAVPKSIMRIHSGQQAEMDSMYEVLRKKMPPVPMELTQVVGTQKFLSRVGGSLLPYKDLASKVADIYQGRRKSGALGTVMISHCPLDFHMYKKISNIQLLESYTGTILSPSGFGQKLCKEVQVPFNTTTHRLFGDSVQLEPLLKGKDKTKLIEVAGEFTWYIKTETEILNDALFRFPSLSRIDLTKFIL